MCASIAKIAEKALRIRNFAQTAARSEAIDVNYALTIMNCARIVEICEETVAISGAIGATLAETSTVGQAFLPVASEYCSVCILLFQSHPAQPGDYLDTEFAQKVDERRFITEGGKERISVGRQIQNRER